MTSKDKNVRKFIGFDLDGVIVDHTELKIKLAGERGYVLTPDETHSTILKNKVSKDILKEIQRGLYCDNNDQPLVEGVGEMLKKVKESNIPFCIVSRRRNDLSREQAVKIMEKRGLWPEIFNKDNVYFVNTPEEKEEIAKTLGITHYVDDEEMVLDVMNSVENRFLLDIYDNFPDSKFKRVLSWQDFLEANI